LSLGSFKEHVRPFLNRLNVNVQIFDLACYSRQAPAGHWGHTFWRTTWAQTYMSRIGDQTGGEAYNITGITVTTLAPYFDDIPGRLQRQYDVAFTPEPQSKAGFVPVT
jgi:hypothetical protein